VSKFHSFGPFIQPGNLAVDDKMHLGGKGAGLVRMSSMGIPVPPGFTIPTPFCAAFEKAALDKGGFIDSLMKDVHEHMQEVEAALGYAPLVSVRSGAPVSMPGMMDTILNVGLTNATMDAWKARIGERAALDSYRRLIQMLGCTAYGVDHSLFEAELVAARTAAKVAADNQLNPVQLVALIAKYLTIFHKQTGSTFPDTVEAQLHASIGAVFASWHNERAVIYRKMNGIDASMGTAVTVQAMVFGNMNDNSGSGVLFSRNPSTGVNELYGEFLPNAQGEDVVAGIRTPLQLIDMQPLWPEVLDQLNDIACKLEGEYADMVDLEFTVQDKVLYLLQCRPGKRGAMAAFRIARDLEHETVIDKKTAISRLSSREYKLTRQPVVDPKFKVAPVATGLFGSTGVAVGKPVYTAAAAIDCKEPCILVTHETDPDDVGGMYAAKGVLTATGGQTSHAAVVARGMNKPCVVGCIGIVELIKKSQAKMVTIDGATGQVWLDVVVPVVDNSADEAVAEIVSWIVKSDVSPVCKIPSSGPAIVQVADWKMEQLNIMALMSHPDPSQLTLDFRAATQISCEEDEPLASLYGDVAPIGTPDLRWLLKAIEGLGSAMSGLTVIGAPSSEKMKKAGVIFLARPVSTLVDMLDGGDMAVSPAFSAVLEMAVYDKIAGLLKDAGKEIKATVPVYGLPAEYQVFKALS